MSTLQICQANATLESMTLAGVFQKNLDIPDYQRSYSWRDDTHVDVLLKDLLGCNKPYLMGTILLHEDQGKCNIVDGQQRLITLTILCKTVFPDLSPTHLPILEGKFSVNAAQLIQRAQRRINTFWIGLTQEEKSAFKSLLGLEKSNTSANHFLDSVSPDRKTPRLLFHVLTLRGEGALDLAYTFFDSVNSKGKPLTDFDLLKAHHLMYIPDKDESLASQHNDAWLRYDENHGELFSDLLRRIRMWSRNGDRDSKEPWPDFEEFSSIVEPDYREVGEHVFNRYMQPAAFRSWRRDGERIVLSMDFPVPVDAEALLPFEITQTIEGGDAFFLYAKRYHKLYQQIYAHTENNSSALKFLHGLTASIDNRFLKPVFKALMLLYVDKFGEHHLQEASVCIERIISEWRWKSSSVRIEGTLSHVKNTELVPLLLNAVSARHAIDQLYRKSLSISRTCKNTEISEKKVVRAYEDKLRRFYEEEKQKINSKFQRVALFLESEP